MIQRSEIFLAATLNIIRNLNGEEHFPYLPFPE